MSMPRKADALERIRVVAVRRVEGGESQKDVAAYLEVGQRSVRRWVAAAGRGGEKTSAEESRMGRPPKLDREQEAEVLSWMSDNPERFGFVGRRWTAPRVAEVIEREMGVTINHRYLNRWLARRGITPQVPDTVPAERDETAVRHWVRWTWPRIKKSGRTGRGPCFY